MPRRTKFARKRTKPWDNRVRKKLLMAHPACEKVFAEVIQDLQRKMPQELRGLLEFSRQHPVPVNRRTFFGDFYFKKSSLIIEIDGAQHCLPARMAKDSRRTAMIESTGIRVRRISNDAIRTTPQPLLERIALEFLVEHMTFDRQAAILEVHQEITLLKTDAVLR